ncbi:DUF4249 domain-containing protein [Maribellus comscasis]|nr:DUF4249 domain-containing protein [Maribellus comscasis]
MKLIFPVFILLFWGCEKKIDVDLNETNPVIVIEGTLSDNPNMARVKISNTTSYFSTEPAEMFAGATVKIADEEGRQFELAENNGEYKNDSIIPNANSQYTLSVTIGENIYESVSKMHRTVFIDSMGMVLNEDYSVLQKGYNVYLYFHDPPGENNYYRLKMFLNGEEEDAPEDFIVFDDNNTNGKFVELRIRRKIYEIGDTVKYELQTLDKAAYEYFSAVSELIDENSAVSASPANPNPNFSNGALGYFSAYSCDEKTIVIQSKIKSLK